MKYRIYVAPYGYIRSFVRNVPTYSGAGRALVFTDRASAEAIAKRWGGIVEVVR